jgi:hypothetical protein
LSTGTLWRIFQPLKRESPDRAGWSGQAGAGRARAAFCQSNSRITRSTAVRARLLADQAEDVARGVEALRVA